MIAFASNLPAHTISETCVAFFVLVIHRLSCNCCMFIKCWHAMQVLEGQCLPDKNHQGSCCSATQPLHGQPGPTGFRLICQVDLPQHPHSAQVVAHTHTQARQVLVQAETLHCNHNHVLYFPADWSVLTCMLQHDLPAAVFRSIWSLYGDSAPS